MRHQAGQTAMIESEILQEIKEEQAEKMEEPYHWQPVSNIPVEEIYENMPEVKEWHDNYERFWLNKGR